MNIDLSRLDSLPPLGRGAHTPGEGGACLLEAAAYVAGWSWSDHPSCVSPVLALFGRRINDAMPDELRDTLLRPLVPLLIGTSDDDEADKMRGYIAADWAVRTAAPMALRAAGHPDEAARLSALPAVVDLRTACRAARTAAEAADLAEATDAAWAAARTVDAASTAAEAADATDAAWAAAKTAEAARAAIRTAGTPTDTDEIWHSAADCLRRMCEAAPPCSG